MRSLTILGVIALSTGCAAIDSDLQYRGTLNDTPTNGVVLFEDGSAGHAAMGGTTCQIEPNGGIQNDVDVVEDAEEEILDGSKTGDGSTVLARTRGQLHIMQQDGISTNVGFDIPDTEIAHVQVPGITDARFVADGIMTLADCTVAWTDLHGEVMDSQELDVAVCTGMNGSFDVDRVSGTAFVNTDKAIYSVTKDAVTLLASSGDTYAVSQELQGLAIADAGSANLTFTNYAGEAQWTANLSGNVVDIADFGARGWVGVMTDGAEGAQLQMLDGATGAVVKSFHLPDVAEVVPSANGEVLALVLPNAVHYYNLR